MRIAKFISSCGYCSRRDAEKLINQGIVSINNMIITTPAIHVGEDDQVRINNQIISPNKKTRLWLFYKPEGIITTHKDPQGRTTLFEILPKNLPRLISIGRLDINSEGLILLTNDGDFARQMELPTTGLVRVYKARAFSSTEAQKIDNFSGEIEIEDIKYKIQNIKAIKSHGFNLWFEVSIAEGKNREVRKILEYFGYKVNRLIRTSYGPYHLGNMGPGEIKEVKIQQI